MKYGIGIDTGGTFTDSVLMDLETGEILDFAKVPTTHHNLKKGIDESLEKLIGEKSISKEDISLVGVSSTLATNAVVEDKGGDVALLIIGLEKHFELPVAGFKFIKGGHDVYGNEAEKLDIETLMGGVSFFRGRVDSYAVISSMSFANPDHEMVAKKAIEVLDNKPVYISSELSSVPGLEDRAATTVLNARLMPVMESFIGGLKTSVERFADVSCLKIIDGEGGFLDFENAVKRSVKTFGSGPASTAFYGASCSEDAIVIDIGGTTTDILIVENSKPVIDENSRIGNLDTHVKSVRMKTIGLGGDSKIGFTPRGEIFTGPLRVDPICFNSDLPDASVWLKPSGTHEIFTLKTDNPEHGHEFLGFFKDMNYLTLNDFFKFAGHGERTKEIVQDLVKKGMMGACGFTPTDALAVLGRIDAENRAGALKACEIYASFAGMSAGEFCKKVLEDFEIKIADSVIDFLVTHSSGKNLTEVFPDWRKNKYLKIDFGSRFPITGAGAAAGFFLPGVAEKLSSELILPEYHEVGNAVGTLKIVCGER